MNIYQSNTNILFSLLLELLISFFTAFIMFISFSFRLLSLFFRKLEYRGLLVFVAWSLLKEFLIAVISFSKWVIFIYINKKNFNWKIYLMFMILILFYNKITKFYYKK